MKLRMGTRGSDLALWQTRWVAAQLRERHPEVELEEVILRTHAEERPDDPLQAGIWPAGGFVAELERALLAGEVDLAVHSYKDLTTKSPAGLIIAAVPVRAAREDRLVCKEEHVRARIEALLDGTDEGPPLRIATSSPRRAAQLLHWLGAEAVPIRGNVPTRLAKAMEPGIDAVMLAGAGLDRLQLKPPHVVELALEDFPTAPAQGALAIQTRVDSEAEALVRPLDVLDLRRAVDAERAFLAQMDAGCHSAVAAMAEVDGSVVRLHAQVFVDTESDPFDEVAYGTDAALLGRTLARRAIDELGLAREGETEPAE
ncbi:MAG: hydroxymethylbilane synthase [Planctomycetota bacterium]